MNGPQPPQPWGTVHIETLGCKLNLADSEILSRSFERSGFSIAPAGSTPSVYVLNTCTITHVADRKARHLLRMARRRHPKALIVATGCYAQRDREALERIKTIDLVIGNDSKARVLEMVKDALHLTDEVKPSFAPSSSANGHQPTPDSVRPQGDRAFVKIQEGCNDVCSYCIVPRVRGMSRYFPTEDLIREVWERTSMGHQEVVLTGTQLGDYGQERPSRKLEKRKGPDPLAALLRSLLDETTIPRIRISSLQPQDISEELLDLWQDPRMCRHVHLPLQSASNTILNSMRRRYTAEEYAATVDNIRRVIPNVGITTDVIMGYPGETDKDFEETFRFCDSMRFSAMHLFPYSAREGTSAARMPGQVEEAKKRERMEKMMSLSAECSARFLSRMVGTALPVLWEEKKEMEVDGSVVTVWSGLTDNYIRVYSLSQRDLAGRITPTRLLELASNNAAWGEPIV